MKEKRRSASVEMTGLAEVPTDAPIGFIPGIKLLDRCYQGEFDSFAHGVDAFGADADFVAETPGELFWFCSAATTRRISATAATGAVGSSSGCRDDGVIGFAKNDAGACGFFQGVDRQ